jgi:hypothetical protein
VQCSSDVRCTLIGGTLRDCHAKILRATPGLRIEGEAALAEVVYFESSSNEAGHKSRESMVTQGELIQIEALARVRVSL